MKNWQLYKRDLKTNVVTKAYNRWEPMTEQEAINTLKKQSASRFYHFFVSFIIKDWE